MHRLILCLTIICCLGTVAPAQSGSWVWIKGADSLGSDGDYGTIGVPAGTNEPPARSQPAYWTDLEGNFWLFGGIYGPGNDLWKYDPVSNDWTWVKGPKYATGMSGTYGTMGVPSPLNNPSGYIYDVTCWTDEYGDLWLFGGIDNTGKTNEILWRYHIPTNEWTWMRGDPGTLRSRPVYGPRGVSGSSYTPGSRERCHSAWVYDKKLWLFGGFSMLKVGLGSAQKNDLWSYNIASNNWTWESGTSAEGDSGSYGIKGVPSAANMPRSRLATTKWKDSAGNFYLFSGTTYNSGPGQFELNDVWRYNPGADRWTWISGTDIPNDTGYGKLYCASDTAFIPQGRYATATVQTNSTCTRAFWSFGGFLDVPEVISHDIYVFNDLWLFNGETLEWTKLKGGFREWSMTSDLPFHFGTRGVPDTANMPPGRGLYAIWTDKKGYPYIYGGATNMGRSMGVSNDLWKFIPDKACFNSGLVNNLDLDPPADTLLCAGDTIKMKVPAGCTFKVTPATGTKVDTAAHVIQFFHTVTTRYTVEATALDTINPCRRKDNVSFIIKRSPAPLPLFDIVPGYARVGSAAFRLVNKSLNAVAYEWYYDGRLLSAGTDLLHEFPGIGKYCVTLVAVNSCGQRDSLTKCCYVIDTFTMPLRQDTVVCAGDTVAWRTPAGVHISITPATGYTLDSVKHTLKFYPAASTRYIIRAIHDLPASLGLAADTSILDIGIYPAPKAAFDISPEWAFVGSPDFRFASLSEHADTLRWYLGPLGAGTADTFSGRFPAIGTHCMKLVAGNNCRQYDSVEHCFYVLDTTRLPSAVDTAICHGDTITWNTPLGVHLSVLPARDFHYDSAAHTLKLYPGVLTDYTLIAAHPLPAALGIKNDTALVRIRIRSAPEASFTVNPAWALISAPDFSCLNSSVGATEYEWYYEGAVIDTLRDISKTFPVTGKHCITLVARNVCGQRDTATRCVYVLGTDRGYFRSDTICSGDSAVLQLPGHRDVTVVPAYAFRLDTITHRVIFNPDSPVTYLVVSRLDASVPADTYVLSIQFFPKPQALFNIDPAWAYTDNAVFTCVNGSVNAMQYAWYDNHALLATEKDLVQRYPDVGVHCLDLVAMNQCRQADTARQCCTVFAKGRIAVPNSFTPDGNGVNDRFRAIVQSPYKHFELHIYNRYGQEIFSAADPSVGWDGTTNGRRENAGVYYYMIRVQFDYTDAPAEIHKGDVTLLR